MALILNRYIIFHLASDKARQGRVPADVPVFSESKVAGRFLKESLRTIMSSAVQSRWSGPGARGAYWFAAMRVYRIELPHASKFCLSPGALGGLNSSILAGNREWACLNSLR